MTADPAVAEGATRRVFGLAWPARVSAAQKRSLVAGSLGWMLDAMDVMLYSMVLAHLMRDLGMDKAQAGFLNSLTLFASALGGGRHCGNYSDSPSGDQRNRGAL